MSHKTFVSKTLKMFLRIHYPWYILLYQVTRIRQLVQQLATCWMIWMIKSQCQWLSVYPSWDSISTLH